MKAIKSTDPRKKKYVTLLKSTYDVNKVTNVREDEHKVYGDCHRYLGNKKYSPIGTLWITKLPKTL